MDETSILDWLYDPIGVLRVISEENAEGNWVRIAEYLDIPGCVAVAETAEEAVSEVEKLKEEYVRQLRANWLSDSSSNGPGGCPVPVAWRGES